MRRRWTCASLFLLIERTAMMHQRAGACTAYVSIRTRCTHRHADASLPSARSGGTTMRRSTFAALLVSTAFGAHAAGFTLTSPTIKPGSMLTDAQVFKGFGCEGKNVSPALKWSGAPAGTKSYAVTVYDPDAPTGSGWWHWVVYNIPATATELPEGAGAGML